MITVCTTKQSCPFFYQKNFVIHQLDQWIALYLDRKLNKVLVSCQLNCVKRLLYSRPDKMKFMLRGFCTPVSTKWNLCREASVLPSQQNKICVKRLSCEASVLPSQKNRNLQRDYCWPSSVKHTVPICDIDSKIIHDCVLLIDNGNKLILPKAFVSFIFLLK